MASFLKDARQFAFSMEAVACYVGGVELRAMGAKFFLDTRPAATVRSVSPRLFDCFCLLVHMASFCGLLTAFL